MTIFILLSGQDPPVLPSNDYILLEIRSRNSEANAWETIGGKRLEESFIDTTCNVVHTFGKFFEYIVLCYPSRISVNRLFIFIMQY